MAKAALLLAFVVAACTVPSQPAPTSATSTTMTASVSTSTLTLPPSEAPRRPFPTHAGYATPHLTPSAGSIDDDTVRYYDYWKVAYLDGLDVPADGEGYAMLITAFMAGHDPDAHLIFDGVTDALPQTPRFEVAADAAFALLLADRQWGSDGTIDYRTRARVLIRSISKSMVDIDPPLPVLDGWLRLSNIMPDHFTSFSAFTYDTWWDGVTEASRQVIDSLNTGSLTGLVPAFVTVDGNGHASPVAGNAGAFSTDAAPYPLRIAVAALTSDETFWSDELRKGSHWAAAVTEGNPLAFHNGYHLDGTPIDPRSTFSVRFGGPLAVAAMLNLDQQTWLDALYTAIRTRHEGFDQDSIALLSMIVLGSNWWEP
jgi:endoglucanase